jgi:Na+/citrate or Na+/malate symporter
VATAMSIAVSAASSYVFITSDASTEYIGFIVAASIMGQVFVIILSDSLKNNENTVAIAAKEKEFETINEHLSKKRMAEIFAEEKDFENNLQNNLETKDNVVNFVSIKERKFA